MPRLRGIPVPPLLPARTLSPFVASCLALGPYARRAHPFVLRGALCPAPFPIPLRPKPTRLRQLTLRCAQRHDPRALRPRTALCTPLPSPSSNSTD